MEAYAPKKANSCCPYPAESSASVLSSTSAQMSSPLQRMGSCFGQSLSEVSDEGLLKSF